MLIAFAGRTLPGFVCVPGGAPAIGTVAVARSGRIVATADDEGPSISMSVEELETMEANIAQLQATVEEQDTEFVRLQETMQNTIDEQDRYIAELKSQLQTATVELQVPPQPRNLATSQPRNLAAVSAFPEPSCSRSIGSLTPPSHCTHRALHPHYHCLLTVRLNKQPACL